VQRVAKAYLKESNRTLATFIPSKNPDRAEIPAAPDIAATLKDFKGGPAISEGEVFDPSPANIESRVARSHLPSGMKLVMLSKKTRGGTVTARVVIRYGDEKSLFGKSAVASLTGSTLMRGTQHKSRQQIQDEADRLKTRISVTGQITSATASIETTEENLAGALKLAAEVLREPAFSEEEFDKVRQQRIAQIEAGRSEPMILASNEIQRRLKPYTRGDARYVATPDEQIEDLKKVSIDDVRKFHQQFYGASAGEIVVVGQFDKAAIGKVAADLFGSWKNTAGYQRISSKYRKAEPANRNIETPDKQNSIVLAALAIPVSEENPDYPALVLANYMTGGSFASRLVHRIRDKEGLSYGVSSNVSVPATDDDGIFISNGICAPQNAPKVEASLKDELAQILKGGFTADEVAAAKKSWQQEEMVGRTQDAELVGLLDVRERYDRTLKFDEALEAKVAALTPEQITGVLRRYVDPANLVFVKAGDFKKAGVFQQ